MHNATSKANSTFKIDNNSYYIKEIAGFPIANLAISVWKKLQNIHCSEMKPGIGRALPSFLLAQWILHFPDSYCEKLCLDWVLINIPAHCLTTVTYGLCDKWLDIQIAIKHILENYKAHQSKALIFIAE